ncbi:MAG: hypothetical protein AAF572_15820 [Cyanobacteria bacterium P01_B01_bin.77]
MVKPKADAIKTVHFPSSDVAAINALAKYTGISFSGHARSALKLYIREHKQLVEEAVQANTEGTTAV